jgi:two-component system cell cycle sensor histidine kinase/response regulator CckA
MSSMIRDIDKVQVSEAPPLSQTQRFQNHVDVSRDSATKNTPMPRDISENEFPGIANSSAPPKGLASIIIITLLVLLTIGLTLLAGFHASSIGWPALILLGGMAVLAFIACLIALADRRTKARAHAPENIYISAFWRDPVPAVIIRDGRVLRANSAYMALAEDLGVTGTGGLAPTVDRMFAGQGEGTAPAIFRLHHLPEKTSYAEEFIETIAGDGRLRRYHLAVSALSKGQLWQISDMAKTVTGGEPVLTHAPVGLFSVDRDGKVIAMNAVLERWLGVDKMPAPDLMREFIESPETLLESPPTPGRIVRADTRLITRKGLVSPTVMVGTWRELDTGEIVASVALYGHSTLGAPTAPSVKSQAAALRSRANLSGHSESVLSAPFGILKLEGETLGEATIISSNPAFERMGEGRIWTGNAFSTVLAPSASSKELLALSPLNCRADEPYEAVLSGDNAMPVSLYIVADSDAPQTCWVYIVDISARKLLEDQLVQSQKMQAIGQLAAGVAHDFNNLLTAIRLNTDELLGRHPVGDPSYPELQKINSTVSRAAGLVKKLLAFSRRQTRRAERVDVTETLSDMVVTLKQTIGERVKLNVVHGRGLPPILADKNQIDTILMNLCVNARDAMADQGGGTITIRSSACDLADLQPSDPVEGLRKAKGDAFVRIEVSDTGTGMPDEVKAKIFEPFFTTKEVGKGTGLGLATVYGIVEQSGGVMSVDSTMGVGTTFRLYFPVADASFVQEVAPKPKSTAPRPPSDLAGQGTILFVEDEDSVRVIAAKTLRKRGYKVIEACDGDEAYEILEDGEETFDLMISDVVMPGMDGPALLKKGRKLLGDARIVFISGYAKEEFSDLLSEEPDVTFLPKPFTLAQLAAKVKAEIGESNDEYL